MYPPRIYTAAQIGLVFENKFGSLGPENYVTGHYTAGRLDTSDQDAIAQAKSFHGFHKSKGWGGAGYHYLITRKGNIVCLRPTWMKGAHVGGNNSNNIGVVMCGTTGDEPSYAQRKSYRWLLDNAHTTKLPRAHRTDLNLANATRLGHNDWPGHTSNGCPGNFKTMYRKGGIR